MKIGTINKTVEENKNELVEVKTSVFDRAKSWASRNKKKIVGVGLAGAGAIALKIIVSAFHGGSYDGVCDDVIETTYADEEPEETVESDE